MSNKRQKQYKIVLEEVKDGGFTLEQLKTIHTFISTDSNFELEVRAQLWFANAIIDAQIEEELGQKS